MSGEHEGVPDATKVYVIESLRETRHALYGELAALGTKVEMAAVTATREHAQVDAKLDQLLNARLESRVTALEKEAIGERAAAKAVDKLRVQQRWFAGFLVAAFPVAIVVADRVH